MCRWDITDKNIMKKIIVILSFLLSFSLADFAQVNLISVNKQSAQNNDPNERFINGISTRLDIGGVDYELYSGKIKFTNYNPFPVTVTIEWLSYGYSRGEKTNINSHYGTVVLPKADVKTGYSEKYWSTNDQRIIREVFTITRKVGSTAK